MLRPLSILFAGEKQGTRSHARTEIQIRFAAVERGELERGNVCQRGIVITECVPPHQLFDTIICTIVIFLYPPRIYLLYSFLPTKLERTKGFLAATANDRQVIDASPQPELL